MIRYAALRLSLVVVVGLLLYLAGMRGVLLLASAIVIAAMIAYIFFPKQPYEAAKRLEQFRDKEEEPRSLDEDMRAEDAALEQNPEDPPLDLDEPTDGDSDSNP